MEEGEDEEINEEQAWEVINAYFEEKGLVRQQLDSFNEFIHNMMQEIVEESPDIQLFPEAQYDPTQKGKTEFLAKRYVINFGQIYLSRPTMLEYDRTTQVLFPNEARLRNLT
jgi:DNA-directed RNA polymerase II subunit RPB2